MLRMGRFSCAKLRTRRPGKRGSWTASPPLQCSTLKEERDQVNLSDLHFVLGDHEQKTKEAFLIRAGLPNTEESLASLYVTHPFCSFVN